MKSLSYYTFLLITSLVLGLQQDTDILLQRLEICHHQLHSCASGPSNVYCHCDQMCIYYDDCCFDAAAITGNVDETNGGDVRLQYLEMTTCEPIFFKENANIRQGVFMVSSCPVSWDGSIDTRESCEMDLKPDIRDMLPVFDVETNIVFKNRQCADCHRVQNYMPWLLETACSPEMVSPSHSVIDVLLKKIHSEDCTYRFIPPQDSVPTLHYCYQEFDYAIIPNTLDLLHNTTCRNRVLKPVLVITGNNPLFFRNLQCVIADDDLTYPEVLKETMCLTKRIKGNWSGSQTLSSLIDFSSMFRVRQTVGKCAEKDIHLSDEVGCQRLYCPAFSEPLGGQCVNVTPTANGLVLDLLFEFDKELVSRPHLVHTLAGLLDTLLTMLSNGTRTSLEFSLINFKTVIVIPGTQMFSGEPCSILHIIMPLKNIRIDNTIESQRSRIANVVNNYSRNNSDGSILRHIENIHNLSCESNVSISNPMFLVKPISVDNDLNCPAAKVQHTGNESDAEDSTKDMLIGASDNYSYFQLSGIIISPSDVVYANEDYFLCIDIFLSKYRRAVQEDAGFGDYRDIINTSCSSVSIICLVYCLFQYCAIPSLRDGKSDLLIVLIILLLVADTLFLFLSIFSISIENCEWLGMMHHFAWLCAFVFMFLCSYRLNSDIRSLQTYTKSERLIATVKYMLFGFSVPLFVIFCTKIANVLTEPMEKWYGGRVCFISQTLVLFVTFVVPVFLIVSGNIVLFICIIRYISSTSISASSNKSNVIVFVKISTVMGFSWIIGIIAILSQSDILVLIFEILSSLQGTFIAMSYSCTNRVRTFYKDCAQQKKINASSNPETPQSL